MCGWDLLVLSGWLLQRPVALLWLDGLGSLFFFFNYFKFVVFVFFYDKEACCIGLWLATTVIFFCHYVVAGYQKSCQGYKDRPVAQEIQFPLDWLCYTWLRSVLLPIELFWFNNILLTVCVVLLWCSVWFNQNCVFSFYSSLNSKYAIAILWQSTLENQLTLHIAKDVGEWIRDSRSNRTQ